jgi:hypothetical protein
MRRTKLGALLPFTRFHGSSTCNNQAITLSLISHRTRSSMRFLFDKKDGAACRSSTFGEVLCHCRTRTKTLPLRSFVLIGFGSLLLQLILWQHCPITDNVERIMMMHSMSIVDAFTIQPTATTRTATVPSSGSTLKSRSRQAMTTSMHVDKNCVPRHLQYIYRHYYYTKQRHRHTLFMINFGPYGDYLNSRVNDDGNNNDDDKTKQCDQITSHQRHLSDSSSSSDNKGYPVTGDATGDFYYYYYSDSSSTSSSSIRATNTNNARNSDISGSNSTLLDKPLKQRQASSSSLSFYQNRLDTSDSDVAAGTFRLLEIPTTSLKPGGLRLFIAMYLLGVTTMVQNDKNSNKASSPIYLWKVDRPSNDEYVIDLYFHDHSAILSIELIPHPGTDSVTTPIPLDTESRSTSSAAAAEMAASTSEVSTTNDTSNTRSGVIYVNRIGSAPSTLYRVHEATILQGLYQEFIHCATDPTIAISDRLLTLSNTTLYGLQTLCQKLPFG